MIIPAGLPVLLAQAAGLLSPVIFLSRNIGGFVADVTIEEIHDDQLVITRIPVEQGAAITDHAYKEPPRVLIRAGWSNSSLQAGGDPNYIQQVYNDLIAFQAGRVPFEIITGKRFYTDMLMAHVHTTTDQKTEQSLIVGIECQNIILVSTQSVQLDPSAMKNPENNAGPTERGPVNAQSSTRDFTSDFSL
jgi:hypothetical protein